MTPLEKFEKLFLSNIQDTEKKELPYNPRQGDVIVVGAIKSGTTWLQQILHQIRTKGDENFKDIYQVTCWLPYNSVEFEYDLNGEQVANPRIYKAHVKYDVLPKCDGAKYIFITRDPYDCQWSFIKYFIRFLGGEEDLSEDLALELFQLGGLVDGDYFSLLSSWYARRRDPNVLWLHYEDMKTDLPFCIDKIAQFICVPLNEQELTLVHDLCTFEYMSKHAARFSADTMLEVLAKAIQTERWSPNCGMVRESGGRVGEGRERIGDRLKEAIAQRWENTVGKELGFIDYQQLYSETSCLRSHTL